MKKYILPALLAFGLASCGQFNELGDAPMVTPIEVSISLNSLIGDIDYGEEMLVKLDNYGEGIHYEKVFSGENCTVDGIIPGIYTINVTGTGVVTSGEEYMLAGSALNAEIIDAREVKIGIRGSAKGKLVFSEIYYCGSKPVNAFSYFRDQFYEIANNTDEVQYLDGLYFGNTETIDFDKTRPIWPDAEGEYIYADYVWRFPGSGTDYPLQPGESCVVAQFAADHRLPIYNPTSPVDCSAAEFEFNTNNANYPDQPAYDMELVYNGGTTNMPMQYLTSVFGTGYFIFRVPDGETWDPIADKSLQTANQADPYSSVYAKVPVHYIEDAVEAIRNESYVDAKNLPAVADAGFCTMGGAYLNVGVTRKLVTDANGAPVVGPNGGLSYQDTNNTTDDFVSGVVPVLHRHSKMPAWNHTLN